MSSECPKFLDANPRSALAGKCRNLVTLALAASALNVTACDDGATEPAPVGWGCVSILDQHDQPMGEGLEGAGGAGGAGGMDCTFSYELPPEGKTDAGDAGKERCGKGELFVYGAPGTYKIPAECGNLVGYANVDIDEGENELYKTRLVDSFCTDDFKFVADLYHQTVRLNEHLGTSSATRCANIYNEGQLQGIEIVDMKLKCNKEGADGGADSGTDCDPVDGRNYLMPLGNPGVYSNDGPVHLTLKANIDLVPAGKEVTVDVTLRNKNGAMQELDVPIIIRGREVVGGAGGSGGEGGADGGAGGKGGSGGSADAGSDAGGSHG